MSKELEALEDIILYLNANEPKGLYCKNIEIIKTALKNYEIYVKYAERMEKEQKTLNNRLKTQTEILRIIKDKQVDVAMFQPNGYSARYRKPLTQEEHDLLKEVLL